MKKIISMIVCLALVINPYTFTTVFGASINSAVISAVSASVDSNKNVSVSGIISTGAGQQVTIRITDPSGKLEYVNNTTSTVNGNFNFSYIITNNLFGTYHVSLGGTGVIATITTSFNYGTNSDLSNLSISSGLFDQSFAVGTISYTTSVNNSVTSVAVTPTLSDTKATVYVNNLKASSGQPSTAINLSVGSNTINVVVTALDGITSKTYTITVIRKIVTMAVNASIDGNRKVSVTGVITSGAGQQVTVRITDPHGNIEYVNNTTSTAGGNFIFSYTMTDSLTGTYNVSTGGAGISSPATVSFSYGTNADLSNLSISSGVFDQAFDPKTTTYSECVDSTVTGITVTPTLSDSKATVSVYNINGTSGQVSAPIILNVGKNTINVVVTALDGLTSKTYTITVTRNKVGVTTITAINAAIDNNKEVTVSGAITSKIGQQVTVRVTDPQGSLEYVNNTNGSNTGNFTFSYIMSDDLKGRYEVSVGGTGISSPTTTYFYYGPDADLNNLTISSGTFDKSFAINTTSYSTSVDYSVSSVMVTPTLSDSKATVSVNGANTSSGLVSAPVSLNYGNNTIDVVVIAADGTTTKTYAITVYRASPPPQSGDDKLSNLEIDGLGGDDSTVGAVQLYDSSDLETQKEISFDTGTTSYFAYINTLGSVTVIPTVDQANATATVTVTPNYDSPDNSYNNPAVPTVTDNSFRLDSDYQGTYTIIVKVTAQNGASKTYTVMVSYMS